MSIDSKIHTYTFVENRKNNFFLSFLGKPVSMYYKPTRAPITRRTRTFPLRCYEKVCWLVCQGEVVRCESMTYDPNGNIMLICYFSSDNQFIALQACRYLDFEYIPTTETYIYTDSEALKLISDMRKGGLL